MLNVKIDGILKGIEEKIRNDINLRNYYDGYICEEFLVKEGEELEEVAFYIVDAYKILKRLIEKIK